MYYDVQCSLCDFLLIVIVEIAEICLFSFPYISVNLQTVMKRFKWRKIPMMVCRLPDFFREEPYKNTM